MRFCNISVVSEHRNGRDDVVDVCTSCSSAPARGKERTHAQLRNRDSCDRDIVIVIDYLIKFVARALGINEKRRIEQEPSHNRSSTSSRARTSSRSLAQVRSGRCRRSRDFTSAPRPRFIGSRWAIALPRRTIVKCSPRCSMASRRSAKFRAASVAVTSGMNSDYQIHGLGDAPRVGSAHARSAPNRADERSSATLVARRAASWSVNPPVQPRPPRRRERVTWPAVTSTTRQHDGTPHIRGPETQAPPLRKRPLMMVAGGGLASDLRVMSPRVDVAMCSERVRLFFVPREDARPPYRGGVRRGASGSGSVSSTTTGAEGRVGEVRQCARGGLGPGDQECVLAGRCTHGRG